ncbi:MAG: AraC family transcriptional regulator, partial [Deltaproteobacteria bacterium]|nr:AraC family transcriptional regulator [Deltaproteobacteria bacterium]
MHYSLLATATNMLWKLIEANGHDPAVLYRDVGVDPDLLNQPGARVPYGSVNKIWTKSSNIIENPCFGLAAHKFWHPSYMHALGYAWLASHTLREALNRFVRYLRVVSEKGFLRLEEHSAGIMLIFSLELLDMRIPAQVDMAMSMTLHMCRINYGEDLKPIAVKFVHAEPPCAEEYFNLFRVPVQFLAETDSMTFALADVDKYLIGANPQLARLNDQVMIEYLGKLDENNIVDRVTAVIVDMLPSGGIADEKIAESLNMSVRSLQRRLKEVGTTFRGILDMVRKDLAETYVLDPEIELVEIAFLLGFSDQSAFSRAFRRWTGNSPSE